MNVRLKRAKELMGYAVRLTKDEGLPTMVKRGAGFVRRRFFGRRARYLPGKKVLEAQAAEMAGKAAENCGLPTISILTPLYNTPENYLREFLDSFVNQTDKLSGVENAQGQDVGDGIFILKDSLDRKSTRLNSSHIQKSRMPSSA